MVLASVMVLARVMMLARVMVLACVIVLSRVIVLVIACVISPLHGSHDLSPEGRKDKVKQA